jgi:hypothetical protein
MRPALAAAVILALASGCAGQAAPAVQPTLSAIETLGLQCGDAIRDNVPSGLLQWSCAGTLEATRASVLVDGNDEGVEGITLTLDDPHHSGVAVHAFGRLVDAVPPLNTAPTLKDTVAGWTGGQRAWTVGGVRIWAECGAAQCIVGVMPSGDALRPLPLPLP